ncbi:hypothetical protein HPT25_11415 [Bacillus sp. BRMEA1]|uniref:hypothetical protein n=1 Tax=Neobacillus endophyticus TaxID=2738405 RepID=UPI0015670E57|nr:hypothetical protein [Neobacillus endophyticus]NRD77993.1 hypothetical protein [Neobacillus endophyticus]
MKKVWQSTMLSLLILLFAAACYGLGIGLKEEEKKGEIQGVIEEKFQKRIVISKWKHYEAVKQYWVKLKNGQKVQIPAYFYQTVDEGEKVSLVKIKGRNLYILIKII